MSILPDPLGLFSSSSASRPSFPPPGQLLQALRSGFGGQMQAMPQQQAQSMFPNANLGGGQAQNATGGQTGAPPSTSTGGLPTFTGPGGLTIAPPPLPFPGNAAARNPAIPGNAGLPVGANAPNFAPSVPTAPVANGGLLGAVGNVLNSVTTVVRNILSPPGTTPGGLPGAPVISTPGSAPVTTPALGNLPAAVVNTTTNVVRTGANVLPGAVTPSAMPQTLSQPTGQVPQAAQPTGTMQNAQAALPNQSAPTQTALPNQTMPAQQATTAPQTLAQTSLPQGPQTQPASTSAPLQQATPMPAAQQAQPTRADAAFAPPGNPAADRAAIAQQVQAPIQPNVLSAPQGATLLAAVPLATVIAQAPVAQQLAGNPQAQATGNPVAGTASLDAGGPVRAELTGTGTYTADGPGLRRRDRMKVGVQEIGQWMLAAAQGRLHLMRPYDDDTPREVAKAFQWLFWVLAIVAYGCLGLVLGSFLLSFGEPTAAPTLRRWTGEFALSGLLAAVGAWWLGRQLTRAERPPPDPIRR